MENKIEIYQTLNNEIEVEVRFHEDTIWLTQLQMSELFNKDVRTINEHIMNIFKTEELSKDPTIRKFRIVRQEGDREVQRNLDHYNLDMIISVGYRVNSKQGVQFRQWATTHLRDYLVQGYAINEKRLEQKQQEVEYLKTGIRIVGRAIEDASGDDEREVFRLFSKGLELLDDYDHEELDKHGKTKQETVYPDFNDYMGLIGNMYSEFKSDVFAQPKDESFNSSINQIRQGFGQKEFYSTIEEKAANLLYFITKNHSFVDGNKRIAAACFLYFLDRNGVLIKNNGKSVIDNDTLAALTLFIATSKSDEAEIVKRLVISILNRNNC